MRAYVLQKIMLGLIQESCPETTQFSGQILSQEYVLALMLETTTKLIDDSSSPSRTLVPCTALNATAEDLKPSPLK
jgi:hypothetical protein